MNTKRFNNDQHLNYEELVAYHQGYLSNQEMHRLELHLIDCALCNEALEGLDQIDDRELEKHLSNIRLKTAGSEKASLPKKQIWAIAASVVLIAIVGIAIFSLRQEPAMIAEATDTAMEKVQQSAEKAAESSARMRAADTTTQAVVPDNSAISTPEPVASPTEEPAVALVDREEAPAETVIEVTDTTPPATEDLDLIADMEVEEEVDDTATLMAAAPENDSSTTEPRLITEAVPEDPALAAKAKKGAPSLAQAMDELELPAGDYQPAQPAKGDKAFRRYLKKNLKYPAAAIDNQIEGEVVLKVTVDENGRIANIEVSQSVGYGCDEEAIRLLREGPAWEPAIKNGEPIAETVTITVPFKQ